MNALFDIQNICFHIGEYPVSYVEVIATISGLASVYFAARANVLTWPTGIVNEVFLFVLFLQVQLYADMFLQVYYFVITVYGWHAWKRNSEELKISVLTAKKRIATGITIAIGTLVLGFFFAHINTILPALFDHPAAFPWSDSFILITSVLATWLLARKNMETWILWIAVDVVATIVYALKNTWVLSGEYFVFLVIAIFGLLNWVKKVGV